VKKMLSIEDIEAQTALELPAREMMAANLAGPALVNVQAAIDRIEVLSRNDVAAKNVCINVLGSCD